jgi:hypothetical protein
LRRNLLSVQRPIWIFVVLGGYLKDPLFLVCLVLYFANRWSLKPFLPNEFSRCYLNDVICLPFWLPIMLFLMRKTGLRRVDTAPGGGELLIPLLLWSWAFELFLPGLDFFRGLSTCDYRDILCYTVGTATAAIVWRLYYGAERGPGLAPGMGSRPVGARNDTRSRGPGG